MSKLSSIMIAISFLFRSLAAAGVALMLHAEAAAANDRLKKTLELRVKELTSKSFSELQQQSIRIAAFEDQNFFFEATVDIPSLLIPWRPRVYLLRFNKKLAHSPPPPSALKGILAHELAHFLSYEKMSIAAMAILQWRYWFDADFRRQYERDTDRQAIARGHGVGLINYRHWLYQQLEASEKKKRKETYLTPEEITQQLERVPNRRNAP